jgi:hypothetical protein
MPRKFLPLGWSGDRLSVPILYGKEVAGSIDPAVHDTGQRVGAAACDMLFIIGFE